MPRRTRSKTPRGVHFAHGSAEKAQSFIRECKPGNPWFEGAEIEDESPPKFVARKSSDLLKIRSHKDRVEALLSSPMIDARPRSMKRNEETVPPNSLPNKSSKILDTNTSVSSRKSDRATPSTRCSISLPGRLSLSSPFLGQNDLVRTPSLNSVRPHAVHECSKSTSVGKENIKPSSELIDASAGICTATSLISVQDPSSFADLRHLVESETTRLRSLCDDWSNLMTQDDQIPEVALNSIRNSIGQCRLLLSKKIPFLVSLIDDGEKQLKLPVVSLKTIPTTRLNDVLGYWSLVTPEITLIDSAFYRLHQWRSNGHWNENSRPITPARSTLVNQTSAAVQRKHRVRLPKRISSSKPTTKTLSTTQSNKKTVGGRQIAGNKLSGAFVNQVKSEIQMTPSQSGEGHMRRSRRQLVETLTPLGLLPVTPSRTRSSRKSTAVTSVR